MGTPPIAFTRRPIRDSKASVKKTCRRHVFSESVAEAFNYEHAAASECEVLALNKHTDGAPAIDGFGSIKLLMVANDAYSKNFYLV